MAITFLSSLYCHQPCLRLGEILSKSGTQLVDIFLITEWPFKIETPEPYNVFPQSRTFSTHIPTFFNYFDCSDLNWAFKIFTVTQVCVTTTKFTQVHFRYWNWWCIIFIKLLLGFDYDFCSKYNAWWAHVVHFFHFHQKLWSCLFWIAVKHKVNGVVYPKFNNCHLSYDLWQK